MTEIQNNNVPLQMSHVLHVNLIMITLVENYTAILQKEMFMKITVQNN